MSIEAIQQEAANRNSDTELLLVDSAEAGNLWQYEVKQNLGSLGLSAGNISSTSTNEILHHEAESTHADAKLVLYYVGKHQGHAEVASNVLDNYLRTWSAIGSLAVILESQRHDTSYDNHFWNIKDTLQKKLPQVPVFGHTQEGTLWAANKLSLIKDEEIIHLTRPGQAPLPARKTKKDYEVKPQPIYPLSDPKCAKAFIERYGKLEFNRAYRNEYYRSRRI